MTATPEFTVLMPARNAARTVGRALRSLDDSAIATVILIDDFSEDETVAQALGVGDDRLRVVQPERHRSLASARNRGLLAVDTEWMVWCDADDAFEPGRASALLELLKSSGADCASDGVLLFDGPSGDFLRELPIPPFLLNTWNPCRLFERNYLPGVGHIAVRTRLARQLCYDDRLSSADDYDFVLRLVRSGARFAFSPLCGYRMFAYPGSDSRHLDRQNEMVARVLRKHTYGEVDRLYKAAGLSDRVASWGLCSMALFRGQYETALDFLARAYPDGADPEEVLEPEGPYPVPEGWRHSFTRGTLELVAGDAGTAATWLTAAQAWRDSADVLNNLGVAHSRLGSVTEAHACFEQALQLFPPYLDARINLIAPEPARVTLLPLRFYPSREDYLRESV